MDTLQQEIRRSKRYFYSIEAAKSIKPILDALIEQRKDIFLPWSAFPGKSPTSAHIFVCDAWLFLRHHESTTNPVYANLKEEVAIRKEKNGVRLAFGKKAPRGAHVDLNSLGIKEADENYPPIVKKEAWFLKLMGQLDNAGADEVTEITFDANIKPEVIKITEDYLRGVRRFTVLVKGNKMRIIK